ncbi:MAG: nucleotidyltransferase family protein [Pseudomonadota bacterium]
MTDMAGMVLAAGLGTRIRALEPSTPKPLIKVAGRPLIDYAIQTLREGGVRRIVINVHHCADQVEAYARGLKHLEVHISDERDALLETGGGIIKALPLLGDAPFFCTNTDAIMRGGSRPPARVLSEAWDESCDALLLMVPMGAVSGLDSKGDFSLAPDGTIQDREAGEPLAFTGLQILRPALFAGAPVAPISTRAFWQKARDAGRMKGVRFDGDWMHVGDPQGHAEAERRLAASG